MVQYHQEYGDGPEIIQEVEPAGAASMLPGGGCGRLPDLIAGYGPSSHLAAPRGLR